MSKSAPKRKRKIADLSPKKGAAQASDATAVAVPVAPPPLRLEYLSASDLADNPANWRTHPQPQLKALQDVLAEVGWAGALLWNERTKRLIDGHARKKVAKSGEPVPVLIGNWTEEQEAKILATLDPLAAMATANKDALGKLLAGVQTESTAIQAMLADLAKGAGLPGAPPVEDPGPQIDKADELRKKWKTARGQLWTIGRHRLLCGDSTDAADVARVMGGERAGLCFTSPPYAQQRDYGEKIGDWLGLMKGVFANVPMAEAGQVLVNLGVFYSEGDWVDYWTPWINWMREQKWRAFGWYVWDKMSGAPGDWCGRCAPVHEWIFHFNRKSRKPNHIIPKKEGSIKPKTGSSLRYKDGTLHTMNYSPESGLNTHKIPDSVWRFHVAKTGGKVEVNHPAVFPTDLPAFAAESFTDEGALMYEPFAGSASTLVAAEQTARRCFGIEPVPGAGGVKWAGRQQNTSASLTARRPAARAQAPDVPS